MIGDCRGDPSDRKPSVHTGYAGYKAGPSRSSPSKEDQLEWLSKEPHSMDGSLWGDPSNRKPSAHAGYAGYQAGPSRSRPSKEDQLQ